MDIRQIEFFVETVNAGSIKKSADLLHITSAGLRLSLHRLEDELDAKLIVWGSNNFTLTSNGETFLYYARNILRSYNDCLSKLYYGHRSTIVNIASGINFPEEYIGSIMLEFQSNVPNFSISLTDYSSEQCDNAVLYGKAELGINTGPFDNEKYLYYPITEYSLYVLLNAQEKDADAAYFPISNLADYNLIVADIKPTDDSFYRLCKKHDISPHIHYRVQRDLAMVKVISGQLGFLGITHRELFESLNRPGIVLIPFENNLFKKTVYLFHRKDAHLSDAALAFKQFILQKVKENTCCEAQT